MFVYIYPVHRHPPLQAACPPWRLSANLLSRLSQNHKTYNHRVGNNWKHVELNAIFFTTPVTQQPGAITELRWKNERQAIRIARTLLAWNV